MSHFIHLEGTHILATFFVQPLSTPRARLRPAAALSNREKLGVDQVFELELHVFTDRQCYAKEHTT